MLIKSSNGTFIVDPDNGQVDHAEYFEAHMDIVCFDVQEFAAHYGTPLPDSMDILDIGYFYRDNGNMKYEPPVEEYRRDIKQQYSNHKVWR